MGRSRAGGRAPPRLIPACGHVHIYPEGVANHRETHPTDVPGCFGCKVLGVNIGGFPTAPTMTERRWEKDMAAYKAIRKQGLQPPQIDGSAKLENASDAFEIEYGTVVPKDEMPRVKESLQIARDIRLGVG